MATTEQLKRKGAEAYKEKRYVDCNAFVLIYIKVELYYYVVYFVSFDEAIKEFQKAVEAASTEQEKDSIHLLYSNMSAAYQQV